MLAQIINMHKFLLRDQNIPDHGLIRKLYWQLFIIYRRRIPPFYRLNDEYSWMIRLQHGLQCRDQIAVKEEVFAEFVGAVLVDKDVGGDAVDLEFIVGDFIPLLFV